MSDPTQYVPDDASTPAAHPRRGRAGWWVAAALALTLVSVGGIATWRWVDSNLLRWGIEDGGTTATDSARLIERVRAFELGTVKQTYAGTARIDAEKRVAAGPVRFGVPGWVAGQTLDVTGTATVTAGIDLAGVSPEDMQITRQGKDVTVLIRLPAPRVLSTELVPNSLDLDTSAGVLTRITQGVGLGETDLRDRAADQVLAAARAAAIQQGILTDAGREAERRLQTLLQSLPQPGPERVTYTIVARDPATQ